MKSRDPLCVGWQPFTGTVPIFAASKTFAQQDVVPIAAKMGLSP